MRAARLDPTCRYLRLRMLGSESLYKVLEQDGEIVTGEVVHAPGLEPGTRVRLRAAAMEQLDASALEGVAAAGRFAAPVALRAARS